MPEGLLIIGSGEIAFVVYGEGEEAPHVEWVEFPLIAVTTTGIILYLDDEGNQNVSPPGPEVKITTEEWSVFSMLTDQAVERSAPSCDRCGDDDMVVSRLLPPVCPQCFRGAKSSTRVQ